MQRIEITREEFTETYGIEVPAECARVTMYGGITRIPYAEFIFIQPEVGDEIEFLEKMLSL